MKVGDVVRINITPSRFAKERFAYGDIGVFAGMDERAGVEFWSIRTFRTGKVLSFRHRESFEVVNPEDAQARINLEDALTYKEKADGL